MLLSLLLAGSMWFYVKRVLVPYQIADARAHARPRGILSDLYPRWIGARELLLHHRDPYSTEVTRDIQTGYYGRPLDPTRPNDPKDQQGFAYPLYVVFLLAPTVRLPFLVIEPVFRWLLVGLVVATVWGWIRFLRWRPTPATSIAVLALTLGSFAVAQGILLEQLTIVVSALVAGALLALLGGHLALAGVLLAVATIKPQLLWPMSAWLTVWAVSDWRRRQRFLWGFVLTGAILALAAEVALPGWIGRFWDAIGAYRQYTGAQSLFETMTTPIVGIAINFLVLLAAGVFCWKVRRNNSDSATFSVASSMVLAATVVTVSSIAPYNQIMLLPAALILGRRWKSLWKSSPLTRLVVIAGAGFLGWPWLAALAMLIAALFVPSATLQNFWRVPLFSSLAIPPAVLVPLALHARRAMLQRDPP